MKVLGIDPSTRALGLAMLDGDNLLWAETIRLKGRLDQRLMEAKAAIEMVLQDRRPDAVVQEAPGPWTRGAPGSTTATVEALAKVRGIIFAAVASAGIPCHEVTANRARHLVLGKGNPKKHVVMQSVRLLGYDVPDEHAADAIVVALAFIKEKQFEERIEAG